MHPTDVKLKLPEKAILVSLVLMLMAQSCCCGKGACFGPIWKTLVFNDDRGYVEVKGKQVIANSSTDRVKHLFKISTGVGHFYLFDPNTRKFICWKKSLDGMIAMDFRKVNRTHHWSFCKLLDIPSEDRHDTHVHLQLADRPDVRMRFDQKGRYLSTKRIDKCLEKKKIGGKLPARHGKHCRGFSNFFVWPGEQTSDCCEEAYNIFCKSKLKHMPELSDICQKMGNAAKCNDTYAYN